MFDESELHRFSPDGLYAGEFRKKPNLYQRRSRSGSDLPWFLGRLGLSLRTFLRDSQVTSQRSQTSRPEELMLGRRHYLGRTLSLVSHGEDSGNNSTAILLKRWDDVCRSRFCGGPISA